MRCRMCNIWRYPTDSADEIKAADLVSLPRLKFINLTGGEPFIREDLPEIIEECYRHTRRIVISTSGWYDDRVIDVARRFPEIGIRVSIEGLRDTNDELRGRGGGFDKGVGLLRALKREGLRDIGFGCTVSDRNSGDMLRLYDLSRELWLEFATAAFHNSYYFHKYDNVITDRERVTGDFYALVERQLREPKPKSWFRAYFNMGLIRYIEGAPRLLPCEAGSVNFFIDPEGEVYPCNGLEERFWKESMGNIRESGFDAVWHSQQAALVREKVRHCPKNCWMVGTAAPSMKRHIAGPALWVLKNKLRVTAGLKPSL